MRNSLDLDGCLAVVIGGASVRIADVSDVEPTEITDAVNYLAGPSATAVTGVVLPVDAGYMVAADWGVFGGLRN